MNALAGTGSLIRLVLRRDRVVLPLWVVVLALIPIGYGSANAELFATDAERLAYANGILSSPAQQALLGPLFGTSIEAITAWRSGFIPIFIALASLLTVIRHTRAEEEAGRRELLGATVVGRQAPLAAALIVTMAADLVLGLLLAGGMISLDLPTAGSFALGLSMAGVGCVFAAIGAVAAQLTEGARAARGIATGVLGLVFVLRAAGDTAGKDGELAWLSWLSPIGWVHQMRSYAGERWWVLLLVAGVVVATAAVAFALLARRDVAAGLVPTRPGPATASSTLRSPLALAWRLHRGVLLAWTAGFLFGGLVMGAVAADLQSTFSENQALVDLIARMGGTTGITDAYFTTVGGILGLTASAYAVSAALRLRSEEESMRAEPLLATSVSRTGWMASHLTFALLAPAFILAVAGLAAGLVHGGNTGDMGREVPRILGAALVQLPAAWLLAGLAIALFGLLPRLAIVSWVALFVCVLLGQVGSIMGLDQWLLDLSPFTHLPKLPGAEFAVMPVAWLVAITVVLVAAGLTGFRRRDIG